MSTPSPFLFVILYRGRYDGRAVSGEIELSGIPESSASAAAEVYSRIADGRTLSRRRLPWCVWGKRREDGAKASPGSVLELAKRGDLEGVYSAGRIDFRIERRRTMSDSDFANYLEPWCDRLGLALVTADGARPLLTYATDDGRRYGRRYGTLDEVCEALPEISRMDKGNRLASWVRETWQLLEVERPIVPTFADDVELPVFGIVESEITIRRPPFDLVVWRVVGCPLLAWSFAPATVESYRGFDMSRSRATANRAVYHIDAKGYTTRTTAPARGLPLYVDLEPSPVLVAPLFDRAAVGGESYPVTHEPRSALARAWRAYREGEAIGPTCSSESEYVRRYMVERRHGATAAQACKRASREMGCGAVPFPPRLPHDPQAGGAFRLEDDGRVARILIPRASLRWLEDPESLGFREIEDFERGADRPEYYTGDTQDETMQGVVFRMPGGRLIAGYRASYDDRAAVVDTSALCIAPTRRELHERFGRPAMDEVSTVLGWANQLAERAAEVERLYNEAWRAGSEVADLEGEALGILEEIKRTFRLSYRAASRLRKEGAADVADEVRDAMRRKAEGLAFEIKHKRRRVAFLVDRWEGAEGFETARS